MTNSDAPAEYSIGGIVSQTFAVLLRAPVPILLVAAVMLLPTVLEYLTLGEEGLLDDRSVSSWLRVLGSMMIGFVAQTVITFGAFEVLRGEPFRIGRAVAITLSHLLPVLAMSVLVTIVISLGMALLIVPGLIAMCILYVAAPACIVEREGPVESMRRSSALTRGYRWRILAHTLVVSVPIIALILLAAFTLQDMTGFWIAEVLVTFLGACTAVMASVAYFRLREVQEGVTLEKIAAVFE